MMARIRLRQAQDVGAHFTEFTLLSFGERVSRVAIGATQIARSESHEDARQTGESAFALQTQIDFVDDQRFRHVQKIGEPLG